MNPTPRILVFLGRNAARSQPELTALHSLGLTTLTVSDPSELESWIRSSHFDLLVWIYDADSERQMESILQKSSNFSKARPLQTLLLARALGPEQIERLVSLGIFWIYVQSQQISRWTPTLLELLKKQTNPAHSDPLTPVRPITVEIRAFGRIGKIHSEPAAGLTLECDLKTKSGATLWIRGAIEDSLPNVSTQYKVREIATSNLYFRSHFRMELDPLFELDPPYWQKWMQRYSKEWVAPKSKLLWITQDYSLRREMFFDKSLFSIYSESPQSVSLGLLQRISPRMIVLDHSLPDTDATLASWLKNQSPEDRNSICILKNGKPGETGSGQWPSLPCFQPNGLSDELLKVLKDFLTRRIVSAHRDSRFLSRNSKLSLASIYFSGILSEISQSQVALLSPFDVVTPALLQIQRTDLDLPAQAYCRVRATEQTEDRKHFRLFCDWIPQGEELDLLFPLFKDSLTGQNASFRGKTK